MSVPRSVTKITKNGVEFTSNIDATIYTMNELIRAALRDSGKYICRTFKDSYYKTFKRHKGRVGKAVQYWVRHRKEDTPNMQVGIKPNGFYGGFQEFGTSKTPKYGLLTSAAEDNISKIIEIQSQYLSYLEGDIADTFTSENDYEGGADE
ncbi:MAG: hypothetical protein ACI4EU_10470 [Butyrivibrio sp.]